MRININNYINRVLLISSLFVLMPAVQANEPGIEVTGTAKVSVVPDKATFSFAINDRGAVLASLKSDIDQKAAMLVALCKKLNIEAKDISASEVSIHPQYNYQSRSFIGYDVSRSVKVVFNDLDNYTALVNGAIQAGITTIRNIALDTKDRENLSQQAMAAAVNAAREKAQILASSSNVRLGKVINIQESGSPVRMESFSVAQSASSQPQVNAVFEPGEISVTATVRVKYEIDNGWW